MDGLPLTDAWLTAGVIGVLLLALLRELVPPAAGLLAALLALLLLGVLPADEAFLGFADPATLTVAGMFVLARALREHGGLEAGIGRWLDGSTPGQDGEPGTTAPDRRRVTLARLVVPTALLSGVMANTPLVAAFAPIVRSWCERTGRPVSRLLLPLSFAAILGGLLTTIGTSPTLLVSGLVARATGEPLGLLEVTPVTFPVVAAGLAVIIVLGPRLVPDRQTSEQRVLADERAYTLPLQVVADGPLDGRTVAESQLRNLGSAFLARIHRDDLELAPVGPDERLRGEDVLVFVGEVGEVARLAERPGLRLADSTQVHLLDDGQHDRFEVVIDRASPLAGRTLKEVSFRGRYRAAVLALHRGGERVHHRLGTEVLAPGDSLLVQASPGFDARWRDRGDFAVIVPLQDAEVVASPRRWLVLGVLGAMLLVAGLGVLPILTAVLLAAGVLVGTRTLRFHAAKESLDLDVLLVIGSAIGLGAAIERSGLAAEVTRGLLALIPDAGTARIAVGLSVVVVATMLLTELITNIAAAAMMAPVALDLAVQVGGDPRRFAIAVAIAASASFLTPIGYQTNTIVYGLGGYRFGDYWRLGLPVAGTVAITTVVVLVLGS